MSNRIPTATGTLKERQQRQAQADAELALEISNSKRLARASRDYWVNGETPINNQPDYTTNEILYDKNKLLKVLANDVKSLLDKEQYAIFIRDDAWNSLRYLRSVVQLFPIIKKEVQSKLRLVTARQLLYVINGFVEDEEQQRADERDPYRNNEEEQYDYQYDYNNRQPGYPIVEEPDDRPRSGVVVVPYDDIPREDSPDYQPQPRDIIPDNDENGERISRPNNVPPPPYMSREDYQAELSRLPGFSTPQRELQIYRDIDRESLNSPFYENNPMQREPMQREISDMSGLTSMEETSLVPYERGNQKFEPDNELLERKIATIQRFTKLESVIQIISKLIRVEQRDITPNASTRIANGIVNEQFRQIDSNNMSAMEQEQTKLRIAKQHASREVSRLYLDAGYRFPDPIPGSKKIYEKYGFGVKPRHKKGSKLGRGCANMEGIEPVSKVDRSELYYSFGTFCIHKKSLGDNILNLKYKSFSQVHKFPKRQLTNDLKDIILDAIETKKINTKLFNALTDSDKNFLTDLVSEARLKDQFANIFNTKVGNGIAVNEPALDRWEILKGQLVSGNTNNEIKKEMRVLINQFMKQKLISAQEGFGILELL
jgi:hypothetical protein